MRLGALALACALGCYHDAPPVLSNGVAVSASALDDPLGFLPIDSEIVVGVDVAPLRATDVWRKHESTVRKVGDKDLQQVITACGFDPLQTVTRIAVGVRGLSDGRVSGVVVVHGVDTSRVLDCVANEFGKGGDHAKRDHDVVIWRDGEMASAWATVGSDTLVVHVDPLASRDSVANVLAGASPLRGSPRFLALYDRLDHHDQLWAVVNGRSSLFDLKKIARPHAVLGSLGVTDRGAAHAWFEMASAESATKLAELVGRDLSRIASFITLHDVRTTGSTVHIELGMTGAQLDTAIAQLIR